jgi:hypothetical protein
MQSIFEIAELVGLMALTFSLAALVEWALLQGIFRSIAAGLEPAENPVHEIAALKKQR